MSSRRFHFHGFEYSARLCPALETVKNELSGPLYWHLLRIRLNLDILTVTTTITSHEWITKPLTFPVVGHLVSVVEHARAENHREAVRGRAKAQRKPRDPSRGMRDQQDDRGPPYPTLVPRQRLATPSPRKRLKK